MDRHTDWQLLSRYTISSALASWAKNVPITVMLSQCCKDIMQSGKCVKNVDVYVRGWQGIIVTKDYGNSLWIQIDTDASSVAYTHSTIMTKQWHTFRSVVVNKCRSFYFIGPCTQHTNTKSLAINDVFHCIMKWLEYVVHFTKYRQKAHMSQRNCAVLVILYKCCYIMPVEVGQMAHHNIYILFKLYVLNFPCFVSYSNNQNKKKPS